MTRIIVCTSGKGGVGKTTLVSNLATVLTELGQNVIAIDANLTTPNLGLHTGLHLAPKTLHDVLKGNSELRNAIYPHALGFKVVPSSMSTADLKDADVGRLPEVTLNLIGKTDYVLIDSAAGLGREAISALGAADEVIIVTNPDLPSTVDALKTVQVAQRLNKKILGVVVNRVHGRDHEMSKENMEDMIGHQVIAEIPEDPAISRSIAEKTPLSSYDNTSPAAYEIRKLGYRLVGRPIEPMKQKNPSILQRLLNWMSG